MNEATWCKLNNCILTNLQSSEDSTYDISAGDTDGVAEVTAATDYMNKYIHKVIEVCVPAKTKSAVIKSRVSDETRSLYERRTKKFSSITVAGGKVSRSIRRRWNKKIVKVNLADYNNWLELMTKEMEAAYERGDTEKIFDTIRKISGTANMFTSKAPSIIKTAQGKEEIIMDQNELSDM